MDLAQSSAAGPYLRLAHSRGGDDVFDATASDANDPVSTWHGIQPENDVVHDAVDLWICRLSLSCRSLDLLRGIEYIPVDSNGGLA